MKKQTPEANAEPMLNKTDMMQQLELVLHHLFGCDIADATQKQIYRGLCTVVREILTEKNHAFRHKYRHEEKKQVYYMSMEFLVGTSLRNNLYNLGVEKECREAWRNMTLILTAFMSSIPMPASATAVWADWHRAIWMQRPAWAIP